MDKNHAIDALGALAQMTRLEAFQALAKAEPDGISAGDLARLLGVPQNTLSTHLSILAHADLVRAERRGRSIIYRANLPLLQAVTLFLVRDCCDGRAEICADIMKGLATERSPSGKSRPKASSKPRLKAGAPA